MQSEDAGALFRTTRGFAGRHQDAAQGRLRLEDAKRPSAAKAPALESNASDEPRAAVQIVGILESCDLAFSGLNPFLLRKMRLYGSARALHPVSRVSLVPAEKVQYNTLEIPLKQWFTGGRRSLEVSIHSRPCSIFLG